MTKNDDLLKKYIETISNIYSDYSKGKLENNSTEYYMFYYGLAGGVFHAAVISLDSKNIEKYQNYVKKNSPLNELAYQNKVEK